MDDEPVIWNQADAFREELRVMARRLLAHEGNAQSIQPSDLIESAFRRMRPAGCELRLMSWGDGSGVPTSSNNLMIVGADNSGLLHVRIFDTSGKLTDTDETKLTTQAGPIEDLRRQLAGLWPPHELTPSQKGQVIAAVTSIVGHIRLDWDQVTWPNRRYFFGAAYEAMRRTLLDHAERRGADKRIPPRQQVQVDQIHLENLARTADEHPEQIEALLEALENLRARHPQWAEVIEHRFYSGCTVEETARIMDIGEVTVSRWWKQARLLLHDEILRILNQDSSHPEEKDHADTHAVAGE
jgi:RNA polymerase sigma factor (sigma-70 family)